MKRNLTVITLLAVIVLVAGKERSVRGQAPDQPGREVMVEFVTPLSLATLRQTVESYDAKPLEIDFEIELPNGGTHSGGYVLTTGDTVSSATEALLARHRVFLDEALTATEDLLPRERDSSVAEGLMKLHGEFEELRQQARSGDLKVAGIRLKNGTASQKMIEEGRLRSVTPIVTPAAEKASGTTLTPQAITGLPSWAPYRGSSKVNQGMAFNTFYFKNPGFASNATYEHESQIYTTNNTHFAYFDNYWVSNMPRAYLDTPFADSIFNPTIGSAQASSLASDTQYYTSISLRAGNTNTATVRIKGQRGHRSPSICYSTWCVWPDQTTDQALVTYKAPISAQISW